MNEEQTREYKSIILGSLLHDIGKIVIRANQDNNGRDSCSMGMEWLDKHVMNGLPSTISTYTKLHNKKYIREIENNNLTLICYQANNLATSLKDEEIVESINLKHEPLMSIFSKIHLKENISEEKCYFHKLKPLSREIRYPEEREHIKIEAYDYDNLLKQFENDFTIWIQKGLSISALIVLLEKYWSSVPSETVKTKNNVALYSDVSFFDHAKVTSAIASCLYNYFIELKKEMFNANIFKDEILDRNKNYFRLIGGDISGVQTFIYTISSKGALKTLRARSFFLELFTEHVVSEIIEYFNLTRANIIYNGGGKFYILSHNKDGIELEINHFAQKINNWLLANFRHTLFLAMTSVPVSGDDLSTDKICEVWSNLGNELSKVKSNKFSNNLSEILSPIETKDPLEKCSICYRDDVTLTDLIIFQKKIKSCDFCKKLYSLGDTLIDCTEIQGKNVDEKIEDTICLPKIKGHFISYSFENRTNDADRTYLLNNSDINKFSTHNTSQLCYCNYVRIVNDLPEKAKSKELEGKASIRATASFQGLSLASRGASRIGVLRMDIDHLAKVFLKGLDKQNRTFSKLSTLSRELTLFFKHYIRRICERKLDSSIYSALDISEKSHTENKGRNISIIYSGGDDLFLVGSWDDVVEVAFDINNSFKSYTCGRLSISGGIITADENYPLHLLADLAGDAENLAKDSGRNSLALFYNPALKNKRFGTRNTIKQVFSWDKTTDDVLKFINLFKTMGKIDQNENRFKSEYAHGLIYKLFSLFELWEREGVIYLPRMAYVIARVRKELSEKINETDRNKFESFLMNPNDIINLRIPLIWIELLSRAENLH